MSSFFNRTFFLAGLIVFTWTPAFALNEVAFSTLRQKGMGGTGIALTQDIHALHTNPAGIQMAQKNKFYAPFGFSLGQGDAGYDTLSHAYDVYKRSHTVSAFNALVPSDFNVEAAIQPLGYTQPGFAVGLFGQGHARLQILNPVTPRIEGNGFGDAALYVGVAKTFAFLNTPLTFGASVKYLNRARLLDSDTGSTIFSINTSDLISGDQDKISNAIKTVSAKGLSGDFGILMPLGSGQFGAVLHNIGSSLKGSYESSANEFISYSESLPLVVGFGYAMDINTADLPWAGKIIGTFTFAADYRFEYRNVFKNMHLGVEKTIWDKLSLRGGINQGYPTVGLGFDFNLVRLHYAFSSYEAGEDVGDAPVSQHQLEMNLLMY